MKLPKILLCVKIKLNKAFKMVKYVFKFPLKVYFWYSTGIKGRITKRNC